MPPANLLRDITNFLSLILNWLHSTFSNLFLVKTAQEVRRTSNLKEAREILKVGPGNLLEAIKERSLPNGRLKRTFHIENAFTTFDTQIHGHFVNRVKSLINVECYVDLRDFVRNVFTTEKKLMVSKYGSEIPFRKFLMISVFKFSILKFLGGEISKEHSQEELTELSYTAAEEITSLWLKSKHTIVPQKDKEILFKCLKEIFPMFDMANETENPLCLIIPSFETLWRVLYRLTVQLKVLLNEEKREESVELLRHFGQNPSRQTFREMKNNISPESIVKEILFLYPPTRTIYRGGDSDTGIQVSKIHRKFTGEKNCYFPERWAKESPPFLTFGYSKLECPAKKVFAPVALGLMATTVFELFKNYQWVYEEESTLEVTNDRLLYKEFNLRQGD